MAGELFAMNPRLTSTEIALVDNATPADTLLNAIADCARTAASLDVATGHLDVGGILALRAKWPGVPLRILMGNGDVSLKTRQLFEQAISDLRREFDASIDAQKRTGNDFLDGVDALAGDLRDGRIVVRIYRPTRFHAKAYVARGRDTSVAVAAFVGSSNFTLPGLAENVELNVRHEGSAAQQIAAWFDRYWAQGEDVTAELLTVVERQVRPFSPFEVYARGLQILFADAMPPATEWEKRESLVYPKLDPYQQDAYHQLVRIADRFGGAFLCDGVGLGKTFVGLMLLERLTIQERRQAVLLVPKAARKPVWEQAMAECLPRNARRRVKIYNHTDLIRQANADRDFPQDLQDDADDAAAFVIDEAHHFRNPGIEGRGAKGPSRYRRLYDLCGDKQMFLLTATPVNNRLIDLQHMMELFTRKVPEHFQQRDPTLGIHSLPGHFRKMEAELKRLANADAHDDTAAVTDLAEAERVLGDDRLFRRVVVQRSRSFVKRRQAEQPGGRPAVFPIRQPPRVAEYRPGEVYGRLLTLIERAFGDKKKPLFKLAIYSPLDYPAPGRTSVTVDEPEAFPGATKGRQVQVASLIRTAFLKRFESSAEAFRQSCLVLVRKLLAFAEVNAKTAPELARLAHIRTRFADLVGRLDRDATLYDDPEGLDAEDLIPPEMLEDAIESRLDRKVYDVAKMLDETFLDLETAGDFLKELVHYDPDADGKLQALIALLTSDPDLVGRKVLIFTEYTDTARYLKDQLALAGVDGLAQVDGSTSGDRGTLIRQFAPYYNASSSADLAARGLAETRVLISTDVLSEGLNLQDAARMINYDLHWNPVRLMQRIGRVDRRMNPAVEERLIADHPEVAADRGTVVFWNFLPPEILNRLLSLWATVTHKTLRISKLFGIEGRQLFRPDDEYAALKEFNEEYDGKDTPMEELQMEWLGLIRAQPDLAGRLSAIPDRAFTGRAHPTPGTRGVFFCYRLPGPPTRDASRPPVADASSLFAGPTPAPLPPPEWGEADGVSKWVFYDLSTGEITQDAPTIAASVRSDADTLRRHAIARETLREIRVKVELHLRNTHLKDAGAPGHVRPVLKAWMELN